MRFLNKFSNGYLRGPAVAVEECTPPPELENSRPEGGRFFSNNWGEQWRSVPGAESSLMIGSSLETQVTTWHSSCIGLKCFTFILIKNIAPHYPTLFSFCLQVFFSRPTLLNYWTHDFWLTLLPSQPQRQCGNSLLCINVECNVMILSPDTLTFDWWNSESHLCMPESQPHHQDSVGEAPTNETAGL